MFREPSERDDVQPIAMQPLLDGGADDSASDVSFGAKRRTQQVGGPRRSRTRWWVAGLVAVSAATVFAVTRPPTHKSKPAPTTTTTAAAPAIPPATVGVTISSVGATATATPSVALVEQPGPLFANDAHLGLFIRDQTGVTRIDLETGASSAVAVNGSDGAIGLAHVAGSVEAVTLSQLGTRPVSAAIGGDADVWIIDGDQPELHHVEVDVDGRVKRLTVDAALPAIGFDTYLIGLNASGNPVLELRDNRAYEVDTTTGALHRISNGVVNDVQNGFFAETDCGDDGRCIERLHGSGGVVEFPAPNGFTQASFSPDGTRALFTETMEVGPIASMIDLRTSTTTNLPTSVVVGDARGVAWTPDSSELFRIGLSRRTGEATLTRIDARTGDAETIAVTGLSSSASIIGIG